MSGDQTSTAGLSAETLTTFCATTVDDQTTVFSGHTGTETVSTFALQYAGLESSFHCLHLLTLAVRKIINSIN